MSLYSILYFEGMTMTMPGMTMAKPGMPMTMSGMPRTMTMNGMPAMPSFLSHMSMKGTNFISCSTEFIKPIVSPDTLQI